MCNCNCNKKENEENIKIVNVKPQKHGTCCSCQTENVDLADGFMCKPCCDEHEKYLPFDNEEE